MSFKTHQRYALFIVLYRGASYFKQLKLAEEFFTLFCDFLIPAERAFWDILAQPDNQNLVFSVDSPTYFEDWKNAVHNAANEAYSRTCPAGNARQMEAFAQGFSKLSIKKGKKDE